MEPSLWEDSAPPPPDAPPLAREIVADVAVIGAGILGLSTALALARLGKSVVVTEAACIGAGASGRNGGLVVPSLPRIGPEALDPRLAALVAGSAAATFALIRELGIACEASQSGWLHPAHAENLAPRVAARTEAWQRAGAACVWLDAAETRRRMGTQRVHGALFDPTGGHINPLAYTRGLASAVLAAGGLVFTKTPVLAATPGDGWLLRTPGGTVRAGRIVQCTNGQPPGMPDAALRDSTVPLQIYQMATPVLAPSIRGSVLAGNEAFSDTRNNLLACRWTASGRLVTGGMATFQTGASTRLPRIHARRLAEVFPALAGVSLQRIWRGQAALTGDFRPRLFQAAPGWLAPITCNGRGIALSVALGQALGAALAGGRLEDVPVPLVPPKPIRPQILARLVPQWLLPLGDWQDRRAERALKTTITHIYS